MIIKSDFICNCVSWIFRVEAITLWPFIICRKDASHIVLNHERIHLKQQEELFVMGFYILYLWYFIKNWTTFKYKEDAYLFIPFEREAYELQYLEQNVLRREKYGWRKYL